MKITFVTPTPLDLSAFGVRTLSAFLKQKRIEVRNIFLPGGIEKYRYRNEYLYQYSKKLLDEIVDLCKGSDLIGISIMSNYFERAIQLTSEIKKATQLPVIWGGYIRLLCRRTLLNIVTCYVSVRASMHYMS